MQTRSKSDTNATSRLRTRCEHAKSNQRLDNNARLPVKSSLVAPALRRLRSSAHTPKGSRRDSHDSGGGGRPNSTRHQRSPSRRNPGVDNDRGRFSSDGSSPPPSTTGESRPSRHSVRKAVLDKQPKPTTMFRHHLFLEPTLARQAKKRRLKDRERSKSTETKDAGNEDSSRSCQQPAHRHHESDDEDIPKRLLQTSGNHESENRPTQDHGAESFGHSRKRTWEVAGVKQSADSPLPCAAKVPRRKMSAVAPCPERSFQVATFRRSRDEELPEGARELIAQADMARQKKKKRRSWPNRHNSHSPCHYMETGRSQSLTRPRGDDGTSLLGSSSTKSRKAYGKKSKRKKRAATTERYTHNLPSQNWSYRAGDVLVRRRQYAIDFLASARDVSSIYAGIVVMNDLYNGDDFPPSVAPVVIHAQAMGIILLTESLTALLAKKTIQDGLNVSCLGARMLVKRLIDHLIIVLMDDMSLHPEKMSGSGLTTSEVGLVSPMLREFLVEIRHMFLSLSEEVLAMGADHRSS